ncbi:MAG: hypothetical protein HOO96_00100 [Polyangiaceae bacterium]|nr:hypothetical protein [Polyangiaceae bacterium]
MKRIALAALLGTLGCGPSSYTAHSPEVAPSVIQGHGVVTSNGSVVTLRVMWGLRGDQLGLVRLEGSDRIVASAPGARPQELAIDGYSSIGLVRTPGTTVTVSLVRPAGTASVDVVLPPAFVIAPPTGPLSRSLPIEVTWEPSPDMVEVTLRSPCFPAIYSPLVRDKGVASFAPDRFPKNAGNCTVELTVNRRRPVDQHGAINLACSAEQVRTITFETTP